MLAVLFICTAAYSIPAHADSVEDGWDTVYGSLETDADGKIFYKTSYDSSDQLIMATLSAKNATFEGVKEVRISSSNTKVCSVDSDSKVVKLTQEHMYRKIPAYFTIHSAGSAVITAQVGEKSYSFCVIATPQNMAKMNPVKAIDYQSIRLSWKKVSGASGYIIARAATSGANDGLLKKIKEVNSGDITSVVLPAKVNVTYGYCVIPKIKVDGKEYVYPWIGTRRYNFDGDDAVSYKVTYRSPKLKQVLAKGTKVQISWTTDHDIKAYNIYRKEREEAPWKLIHTVKNEKTGSYTRSEKTGKTYIYKVEYVRPDNYKQSTISRSCYITKKTKAKKATIKMYQTPKYGQYGLGGAWTSVDENFYYEKKDVLHAVSVKGKKLIDYTLSENGKIKSKKTVTIGSYEYWCGFYAGPDNCLYVAVGYDNPKKSKTKTVVKVMKYSSSWKLQKTCKIKGSASNQLAGIMCQDSNSRMMMYGSKLYLIMGRIMFSGHQSNISFLIDTKTMKYKEANEDYTSHSFNQFIRFDNDRLYISNHGDAYPRAVNLTVVKAYGTKKQSVKEREPFKIKGETGYNYTGLAEGGMEVLGNHVMIAGISVPQNYKVAGVTGNSGNYVRNVFLTMTDKTTLKSQVKWLTTYNPKSRNVSVSEVRTIKLSDDYMALMYTVTKNDKDTLHYVVVNDTGKVVCHKTYKNMIFSAATQPILHNGSIVWTDAIYYWKKFKTKKSYYYKQQEKHYFYKIPAVIK